MKKIIKAATARFAAVFLAIALAVSLQGCLPFLFYDLFDRAPQTTSVQEVAIYEPVGDYSSLTFEQLCDVLFEHEVTWDSLTVNQCVSDPEALGITVPRPATLGDYSYESTVKDNLFYSEIIYALNTGPTIASEQLSSAQQREATYIERVLRETLRYEEFYYYDEPLKPSTGAQAMLPLSLMDYSMRTVEDVEIYLEILNDVPRYFDQLMAHEDEKKSRNLLMAREAMQDTLAEAQAYTGQASTHILTATFNEMLDAAVADSSTRDGAKTDLARLKPEQIQSYKDQNLEAIQNSVIPAYEKLVSKLNSLIAFTSEGTSLANYYRGNDYYSLSMESMGFDYSPSEAIGIAEMILQDSWGVLTSSRSLSYLGDLIPEEVVQAIGDKPEDYITYIQSRSASEFAGAKELNYSIKQAPDASQNDYAMAYFLIPPVDNPQQNTIVYFPWNISDDVELYSTIAHEAYPGHMYQFFAYSLEEPSNISKILGCSAYIEGWAMYAQGHAVNYLNANRGATDAYNAYDRFSYALQARVDLGVNYQGWSVGDTARYLSDWGFEGSAEGMYRVCIEQPVAYLPYGLGPAK
ncbi:MAG: DUF885 domain-containing protein, partial [Coriobacteriales bacterium]|nr:DUF885 domain-containing protein [Coriobacteriales bacterium]